MPDIDTIDRDADLYFVLLAADETEPAGAYRSELKDRLEDIDPDPWPFDPFEGYAEFMENLRFLEALGAIPHLRERRRITLEEKGEEIGEQLRDALDEDQRAAVEEVSPDAE